MKCIKYYITSTLDYVNVSQTGVCKGTAGVVSLMKS